jgi:hypothetical protein
MDTAVIPSHQVHFITITLILIHWFQSRSNLISHRITLDGLLACFITFDTLMILHAEGKTDAEATISITTVINY